MKLSFYPRISIVTPSFNQGDFIEETITSILSQKYPNLEYIVIDGGSTDRTISILEKYSSQLFFWVSEKDNGQSDALNKGFKVATGDICSYLNSDDLYINNSLWEVANAFNKKKFSWLSSDVICGETLDSNDFFQHKISTYEEFCAQQTIGQQGVFWAGDVLSKPWFNNKLRYAMDHQFFIRLYRQYGAPRQLRVVTSFFRFHPQAKTSTLENILMKERHSIGEDAALIARDELEASRIRKEIIRLDLKIAGNKILNDFSKESLYGKKLSLLIRIILIISKAPFPLRDRVFQGFLFQSIRKLFLNF